MQCVSKVPFLSVLHQAMCQQGFLSEFYIMQCVSKVNFLIFYIRPCVSKVSFLSSTLCNVSARFPFLVLH